MTPFLENCLYSTNWFFDVISLNDSSCLNDEWGFVTSSKGVCNGKRRSKCDASILLSKKEALTDVLNERRGTEEKEEEEEGKTLPWSLKKQ